MKSNKGFTLIELLTVLVILSIIMLIAVPNVMSIIDKNKRSTYVEDAKKMITLADYKLRADTTIPRPTTGKSIVLRLSCLDATDLEKGPEGWGYDHTNSFVVIYNQNNTYQYFAFLKESNGIDSRGLPLINRSDLEKSTAIKKVQKTLTNMNVNVGTSLANAGTVMYVCG